MCANSGWWDITVTTPTYAGIGRAVSVCPCAWSFTGDVHNPASTIAEYPVEL
jgi:hypothetical protein